MNVLIIGASGLVGGNCQRYFSEATTFNITGTHISYPTKDTIYFDPLELNTANFKALVKQEPDVIIHCGALTNVDYCETHVEESILKNITSTNKVVELARHFDSKLIYISTDYVFDGKDGPYTEEDITNPICIYGQHKLDAEKLVADSVSNHLIIRITNVYGSEERGKNFIARLLKQIKDGQPINLTLPYDQYATPINAWDIAKAIKLLIESDKRGIFHLGSTDYMNRYQLAKKVINRLNYTNATISYTNTEKLNQAAQRPLQGGLLAHKFLQEYPDFTFTSVDDYLNEFINA